MITKMEKQTIEKISRKYQAKRVMLFGSCLDPQKQNNDIDIAVEGIPNKEFYRFYGDLMFALSKPVDVIDLSSQTKFVQLVKQEGLLLYG